MFSREDSYIARRIIKGHLQSIPFYLYRVFPIKKRKIVFTTIEGTTGFTCNPKYIALELIERNKRFPENQQYELVWLVNDLNKDFPSEIRKVRNTLLNRAKELTTAGVWVDNSRKQLECRKRSGQIYIQTWHAKLGFKPTCLDRGASFSKIAYLVSKHDSDMVDYWLSNSDWYDKTLKTGSLYDGKTIRSGSPRCDILVHARDDRDFKNRIKEKIVNEYILHDGEAENIHFMMYAPTFRGGNQATNRSLDEAGHMPDFATVIASLEKRFGGKWIILLRLHPQMTVRGLSGDFCSLGTGNNASRLLDVSIADDMYELLAGCDAFMTDYSSAAFDAAVMNIPVFLFCDDYEEYESERGKLLWDLRKLPFALAVNDAELKERICLYDDDKYCAGLHDMFNKTGMTEDGHGSRQVVDFIQADRMVK